MRSQRICIVGASASILGKNLGRTIDSHERVVRVKYFPDPDRSKDLGTKSNIYAIHHGQIEHSGKHHTEREINNDLVTSINKRTLDNVLLLDWDSRPTLGIKNFIKHSTNIVTHVPQSDAVHMYAVMTGSLPTTGMCTILHYLSLGYNISVAGFGTPEDVKANRFSSIYPTVKDGKCVYKIQDFKVGDGLHDLATEIRIVSHLVSIGALTRIDE